MIWPIWVGLSVVYLATGIMFGRAAAANFRTGGVPAPEALVLICVMLWPIVSVISILVCLGHMLLWCCGCRKKKGGGEE
jgi:hypothetical protein